MKASKPFATIESSLEFIALLEQSIEEALTDVNQDIDEAQAAQDQRATEALLLVSYKVNQLSMHIGKSRRLLNDLRMLRRVIKGDRGTRSDVAFAAATSGD